VRKRTKGLYQADKMLQLRKPQDNVFVTEAYTKFLGEVGGHKAHELLHTGYQSRRRISDESMSLLQSHSKEKHKVSVCLGTNCYLKGSQQILSELLKHAETSGLEDHVDIRAAFCHEQCEGGPTVTVDGEVISHCTLEKALAKLHGKIELKNAEPTAALAAGSTIASGD
jgi:NADH-quinone oxidoreductase subunit G